MEIDPRLRHGSASRTVDGPEGSRSYVPSPASRHDTTASSTHTASDYPDPPSHYSPGGQLHSATSTSGGHSYYGAPTTKSHSPQILYQGRLSPAIGAPQRVDPTAPNDAFADLKRPRACEACRQLKVRCEPDLNNANGPCKRCAKAGRSCVVTAPTRKRQKKTDSRVAELERKLNALTETLQVTQGHDVILQTDQLEPQREDQPGRRWLGAGQNASDGAPSLGFPASLAGNKRRSNGEVKDSRDSNGAVAPVYPPRALSPPTEQVHENESSKQWRGSWCSDSVRKPDAGSDFVDVIDRGLVSAGAASEAFDRYVNEMAPYMPMVVFPPDTKMNDIRKTKPMLFHAIIATSIGTIQPDAQLALLDDLYKSIAERVVVKGEKSLDLVQALLVACNWYTPPDHFEELKFYQLTNMAVTVGMDIGMNRKTMSKSKHMSIMKDWVGRKSALLDPDSPETRRAWLGCYSLSVQVSTSLRRVLLVRWQPYMDECIEILENSPDALPSDKAVIQWAKLMHLLEDINAQLSTDDSGANVSFSDTKVQYTLKVFEKQIEQWRKETPPEIYNPVLQQVEYLLNIHMRENALNLDIADDQKTEVYSSPPSPAHMNALSVCLTSIHQALEAICFFNTKDLLSLPTVCLARSSTAMVALIKLYSIVSCPETQIGQVIDPASLKVEYYLNKVMKHYTAAGEQAGGRTPAKFSVILGMLLNWFSGRKDQNQVLRDAFKGTTLSGCPPMKEVLNTSNPDEGERTRSNHIETGQTPLHLLSEVAMGEPKSRVNPGPLPYQHRPGYAQHSSAESISQTTSSDLVSHSLGPSSTAESADPWVQYQSVPLSSATTQPQPHAQSRHIYSQFGSNYQDMSGYPDPNNGGNMMIPPVNPGFFIPELGMQVGFDSENLSALGYILGEGFLNLPLPADVNMGYY